MAINVAIIVVVDQVETTMAAVVAIRNLVEIPDDLVEVEAEAEK